jgi:hypothetical protein
MSPLPSKASRFQKPSSASADEMAHYFFDTSALVKRHVIEAGSPWVKSLVRAKAAHTLYIARITAIEVTSAITRRQRTGSLSAAQGGAILGHFRRHLTQRYVIVEVAAPLLAAGMLLKATGSGCCGRSRQIRGCRGHG